MPITTAEGAVIGISLVHPKELDERKQALHVRPSAEGPCPIVCDKGFACAGIEAAATRLRHRLIRPRRHGEPPPGPGRVFPSWLRQRVMALNVAIWDN
nr:hypothetical protein [Actinomadura kijaniata]